MSKASVIIPLYQKAPYIERCLDSVAAQTLADYEVIVVDDGSTDGGGDLVRARHDPRLRVIRQENAGEGAARNRGIAEATGAWVALLDADDEWRPSFLEATLEVAVTNQDLVAVFANILDARSQQPLLQSHGSGLVPDYFDFVMANRGLGMTSMATLARRDALQTCGGFREGVRLGEDHDAFARLAWEGRVAYLAEALAVYHSGTPGSSMSRARAAMPAFPETVRSYRERRRAGRIPAQHERSSQRLANHILLDHIASLLNRGDRRSARLFLFHDCEASSWWSVRYWSLITRLLLPAILHFRLRSMFGKGDE